MKTAQVNTSSIIFMASIFSISVILLDAVLKLQNTFYTIAALIIVTFNAIVTVTMINQQNQRGKSDK